jgi:hypothetical protein
MRASPSTASQVSLARMGVRDLEPLLPLLAQFTSLHELDLSNNTLRSLPARLGKALPLVEAVFMAGNPIPSVSTVLPALASLSNLKRLNIDLGSEAQEDQLVVGLPKLEFFNGLNIGDDEEAEEPSPTAAFEPPKVPLEAPPLPKAAHTDAAVPPPAPANPPPPTADGAAEEDDQIREIAMTEDDLESVALLFGALKALRGTVAGVDDAALTVAFDAHVEAVMNSLRDKLEKEANPFVRQAEILQAKHDLYDIVAAHAAEHAAGGSGSREFGAVLRKLRAVQRAIVAEFPHVVQDTVAFGARKLSREQAATMRADSKVQELVEAASFLEGELQKKLEGRGDMERRFEAERMHLTTELRKLQEENAELRVALRQLGRGDIVGKQGSPGKSSVASSVTGPPPSTGYAARHAATRETVLGTEATPSHAPFVDPGSSATSIATASVSGGAAVVKALTLKQLRTLIEAIYTSKQRFDEKCSKAKLPRETLEQHMYTYLNQTYGLRKLIVEHATAIIRAVNRFSAVDNDVCVFGQILRNEVEEKFVQTQTRLKATVKDLVRVFLKGKFPMKTDAAIDELLRRRIATVVFEEEWSDTIRYMYSKSDAEALCRIVKEVIASDPSASNRLRHFNAIRDGHDSVAAEGAELVGEAGVVRKREARMRAERELHREAVTRGAINYSSLLKTMLDFQLRGHQKFLEKFRRVFTLVDSDNNGVLSEPEFRELVKRLDPSKTDKDIGALVSLVDAYGHGHITFSDCVETLLGSA